jgi:hypothetical protein
VSILVQSVSLTLQYEDHIVSIKDFTNREGAPLGEGSDRSNDLLVEVRTAELRCSMLRCKLHPQKPISKDPFTIP